MFSSPFRDAAADSGRDGVLMILEITSTQSEPLVWHHRCSSVSQHLELVREDDRVHTRSLR